MKEQRVKVLQNMPIFGGIRQDILEFLLDDAPILELSPGEYVFREGDMGGAMYVIDTGAVAVLKSYEGKEYFLDEMGPGDCLGEMSLIDMCHRSASVVAVEGCRLMKLTNTSIFRLYQKDLEQFTLIQMNMAREVSRRLRHADEHLFQQRVEANELQLREQANA